MSKLERSLKGKNGQVYLFSDGTLTVDRKGWFGFLYQLIFRGERYFTPGKITDIFIKKPGAMRGYLRISGKDGNAVVWLTNNSMYTQAEAIRSRVEERLKSNERKKLEQKDGI